MAIQRMMTCASRTLARPGFPECAARAHPKRNSRQVGSRISFLIVSAALGCGAAPSGAANWVVTPSVGLEETLTDNVNLQPADAAKSDLVTQLTPSITFSGKGARASLNGTISVPVLIYARTGSENNNVYPSANILGNVEAIENFLFVDGEALVSQQFLTPFGSQPASLANATENRYTASSYRISPYIKGVTTGNVQYELRNNSFWTTLSGAPISTNNSYTSQWIGKLDRPVIPLGWSADFDLTDVKFNNQASQQTNLGRVGPRYAYDPQILLNADFGYEDNHYPFSSYRGYIYGVGIRWRPTERTNVVANWEHRFFGASYLFNFDHRTPLSVWNLSASRNITSYPQQLASLPAGNVQGILNQLFISRIPDPTLRQDAINALIQNQGLPPNLLSPVNLYTQQILLVENVSASVGLLGARNSVFATVFYLRQEPIAGSGTPLPPILASATLNNNTQEGANLVWTYSLTPSVSLNLTTTALWTTANAPFSARTKQGNVDLTVTSPLSARTTAFAGARYQTFRPDFAQGYNEAAIFAGLTYTFK
jgi:uncharacterized protein (PEP-CTERM system associated)